MERPNFQTANEYRDNKDPDKPPVVRIKLDRLKVYKRREVLLLMMDGPLQVVDFAEISVGGKLCGGRMLILPYAT